MIVQQSDKKLSGEITIFLSLILSVLLGFTTILIESARLEAIKMNIEGVMDASLHSCFGEYDIRLFDRYDLLYVDTSYRGECNSGIDELIRHLVQYIRENTDYSSEMANADWYKETIEDSHATGYIFASDEDGKVMKAEAIDYIRNYSRINYLGLIENNAADIVELSADDGFMSEWDSLLTRIEIYGIFYSNPGRIVRNMMVSDERFMQGYELKSMNNSDIPSARSLNRGRYANNLIKRASDDEAFVEYIMQKMGCYTNNQGQQALNCEIEYVINGSRSDAENMGYIIERLMTIRENDNLKCLKNDEGRLIAAESKARMVVFPLEDELLIRLVRDSIIYAWAYAESAIDVSRLLNKGMCLVRKSARDIELSLEELLFFWSKLDSSGGSGISYKEYIGAFLLNTDDRLRRYRCMDIIECNFRSFYNDRFRIDGCVSYLEAEVMMNSGYGYSHSIKRDYIYE